MPVPRWRRALRLRLAVTAYVLRRPGPVASAVVVCMLLAAALYRFEQRLFDRPVPDFGAAVYAIYTQLFFEPTAPFPETPVARLLFAVTPLAGVLLLAEGLLDVEGAVRVTADLPVAATLAETTVGWLEARVPCRVVGRRTADGLEPLRGDDRVAGGDRLVVDVQAADLGLVRLRLEGGAAGGP